MIERLENINLIYEEIEEIYKYYHIYGGWTEYQEKERWLLKYLLVANIYSKEYYKNDIVSWEFSDSFKRIIENNHDSIESYDQLIKEINDLRMYSIDVWIIRWMIHDLISDWRLLKYSWSLNLLLSDSSEREVIKKYKKKWILTKRQCMLFLNAGRKFNYKAMCLERIRHYLDSIKEHYPNDYMYKITKSELFRRWVNWYSLSWYWDEFWYTLWMEIYKLSKTQFTSEINKPIKDIDSEYNLYFINFHLIARIQVYEKNPKWLRHLLDDIFNYLSLQVD